ncbi:MAG: hypothetical protein JWO76_2220 [Nocardioides sp.]|nr:hypothetical protein [Nocardioides sp.]
MLRAVVVATLALAVSACSADREPPEPARPTARTSAADPSSTPPSASATATATATPSAPATPSTFDAGRAVRHVRVLAGRIGPRLATGPAYREAAEYVEGRFSAAGYGLERQRFPVPAGDSWGVPVEAGSSFNVVATPPGFDPAAPYVVVGAHLDTVAVAPGAEDNASGVSVLLELARLAAADGTRVPVVLVAFGGEEPRGPGDDQHHFGSLSYVSRMTDVERRHLTAMVALDRVGVGARVPVCTGPLSPPRVRSALLGSARRLGIPTTTCGANTASDHWSFEQAGFAVARVGSTPYAGYHSAADVPSVVERDQLRRTGELIWAWLRAR